MKFLQEQLIHLGARLPELEWKIKVLNIILHPNKIPAGLFAQQFDMTAESCIAEIKDDLKTLTRQDNELSTRYLAERISQKINVLVRLCQMHSKHKSPQKQVSFGVRMISTRQQWLQSLQADIAVLNEQHQALSTALMNAQKAHDQQAILSLQAELGEIERRLTLAKETQGLC